LGKIIRRDQFTWLAYFMLAFYGYFLNIFGPITPFLKNELEISYTVSSLHFTAFAFGILLVGFGGHFLIERLGRLRALWAGAFGISLSAILLLAGQTPVLTIGASFFMGIIGSLILAVVPSALSDQFGDQRAVAISEANVISSFVSSLAPILVGWFAGSLGSWKYALAIAALIPCFLLVIFRKAALPPDESREIRLTKKQMPLPFLYWVFWVALMLAVSVEFCMVFWSADYLEIGLGIARTNAAQAVSLFLGAMIIGRLSGSRLVQHFTPQKLVVFSILIASFGFFLFWTATIPVLGLLGLFLTGLGVASLYPLLVSMAIASAKGNTIQAGARATLASGTAILLLPLLLGRLADSFGIQRAYGVVAVLLVSVLLIVLFAGRQTKSHIESIIA
jgi:fucose permease